jgi:ABC-type phosphate transport system substrate-binding protein
VTRLNRCAARLTLAASLALTAATCATPALAGNPGGTTCATDGRIAGSGDTWGATLLQRVLSPGYCGGSEVLYNYEGARTGWVAGLATDSCRADMFSTSGFPYSADQLGLLRERPGAFGSCPTSSRSPFPPNIKPFPARTDVAAGPLTVPVAASTVGLIANLASCSPTGAAPPLQLTGKMVSALFAGIVKTWDDRRLRKGGLNSFLATCKVPVVRVVRSDDAGATAVLKSYLVTVDPTLTLPSPTAAAGFVPLAGDCKWPCYNGPVTNRNWPGGDDTVTVAGDGSVAVAVNQHPGAIGYVEPAAVTTLGLRYASVMAIKGKTFQQPLLATPSGMQANVDLSKALLPANPLGTGAQTWASVPDGSSPINVVGGKAYPIQGLVTVLALPLATTPKAISRSTLNQRQTLLDFLQFALSADTQARVGNGFYAPLPAAWRSSIAGALAAQY